MLKNFNTNDIFIHISFKYFEVQTQEFIKKYYYSTAIIVNSISTSLADKIASVTGENMHVPMYQDHINDRFRMHIL